MASLPGRSVLISSLLLALPASAQDGKLAANAKDPGWYGLSPSLAITDNSGVNFEPENYTNTLSAGFGLRWAMGKMVAQGSYLEPLTTSLSMDLVGELTGYGEEFRTDGANPGDPNDPNGFGTVPQYEPPSSECSQIMSEGASPPADCIPRDISGSSKRLNYSDLALGFGHGKLARIPTVDVDVSGNIRALFPTSLASRNNDVYLRTSYGLALSRSFLSNKLGVNYGLSFAKNFYRYETRTVASSDDPLDFNNLSVDTGTNEAEGVRPNTSYSFTNSLGMSYSFPRGLSATTSYGLTQSFTYDFSDGCTIELADGSLEDVCENTVQVGDPDEGRTLRVNQTFGLGVGWTAREWLSLSLGLNTSSPLRKNNTTDLNNPFWHGSRNGYTSVALGATVTMDKLYANAF